MPETEARCPTAKDISKWNSASGETEITRYGLLGWEPEESRGRIPLARPGS